MSTRTRQVIGFSAPPPTRQQIDRVARLERKTKSELLRGLWRTYYYANYEKPKEDEAMRFDNMVARAIAEGIREKNSPTKTQAEYDEEDKRLMDYGRKQWIKAGRPSEEDIANMIYAKRKAQKARV